MDTELKKRLKACPWEKTIGSALAISCFFLAYFRVMHHPLFPVREMPVLGIDERVPVLPWTVWIYFSLWVYICMPVSLMGTRRELLDYFNGALLLALGGLSIFVLVPTSVPTFEFAWEAHAELAFLKTGDLSGNACPSLHVGYAVFAAFWFARMLRAVKAPAFCQVGNVIWAALIVASTLTTKQHVALDGIVGGLLGALFYWINRSLMARRTQTERRGVG